MTKSFLCIALIILSVSEPFSGLISAQSHTHHRICQTCGMEDMCGDVCCCVHANSICTHHGTGLFAAGCTPDSACQFFFSQSVVKFLPISNPLLFRSELKKTIKTVFQFLPTPPTYSFLPPPKMEHLV